MNIISFGFGVLVGFWVKNELNEGRNPIITIKNVIKNSVIKIRNWVEYCFKKIPAGKSLDDK